jgi:hypothetical protein
MDAWLNETGIAAKTCRAMGLAKAEGTKSTKGREALEQFSPAIGGALHSAL